MARDGAGPFGTLEALKSDPNSSAATLEAVADQHIAAFKPDMQRASITFVAAVAGQQSLAAELFGRAMVESKARAWFEPYARRSGQPEGAATEPVSQGHSALAAPETISVEGHQRGAKIGRSNTATSAEPINGGGQWVNATTAPLRLPPTVDPKSIYGGRPPIATKASDAVPPSARPQSAARVIARAVAAGAVRTLYDSYTVQGRPIGDIRFYEIEQLRSASAQEAAVLRQIQRHCQPESPGQLVRDALKLSDLERFVQRGAEVADAA